MSLSWCWKLQGKNGVAWPFAAVAHARFEYRFSGLQDFLDIYHRCIVALLDEQDFRELTNARFVRAPAKGVHHSETF